jgi:hypothetical protein
MSAYWIIYETMVKYATFVLNFTSILEFTMTVKKFISKMMSHRSDIKKAVKSVVKNGSAMKRLKKAVSSKATGRAVRKMTKRK